MKYTHPNPTPLRAFIYTGGVISIISVFVAALLPIVLVIIFPLPWVGVISGVLLMSFIGSFFVALVSWSAQTKAIKEDARQFDWSYDITKDKITLKALDKINFGYEREGLKFVVLKRSAAVVKHTRGSFVLPFPDGKRQEIVDALRESGWLERPNPSKLMNVVIPIAIGILVGTVIVIATS
jgi:hypothetical protein